jgi:drug/metabolite transporter superfamily protein YnfA
VFVNGHFEKSGAGSAVRGDSGETMEITKSLFSLSSPGSARSRAAISYGFGDVKPKALASQLLVRCFWFSMASFPLLQRANFGRVYAAYGGIFIVLSLLWGWQIDRIKPDRFDLIGSLIALVGVLVVMYWPRG